MTNTTTDIEVYADIFFLVDEKLVPGIPITWDELCTKYFGFSPEKMNHTAMVQRRNTMVAGVNRTAERLGANWRLRNAEYGKRVVKLEDTEMVQSEVAARLKRIGGAFQLGIRNALAMAGAKGLPKKDVRKLRQMVIAFFGASVSIIGQVSQMTSLTNKEKKAIIELLSVEKYSQGFWIEDKRSSQ